MNKYAGVCGCICEDCRLYKKSCEGCHAEKGIVCWLHEVGLEVCDFYECCVIEKGLMHCGECDLIPCEKFWKNKNPKWTDEEHKEIVESRVKMLKESVKPFNQGN